MSGTCYKKDGTPLRLRHGHSQIGKISREYVTWVNMKARCLQKTNPDYYLYGGRGITVCERWLVFDNFLQDLGLKPEELMLERRDNNKGYSLDNCYWATSSQQSRNRRRQGTCR